MSKDELLKEAARLVRHSEIYPSPEVKLPYLQAAKLYVELANILPNDVIEEK